MEFPYYKVNLSCLFTYPFHRSYDRPLAGYSPLSRAAIVHRSRTKGCLGVTFQINILIRNRALNLLTSYELIL